MKPQLSLVERADDVVETDDSLELIFDKPVTITCGDSALKLNPNGDVVIRAKRILQQADDEVRIDGKKIELG